MLWYIYTKSEKYTLLLEEFLRQRVPVEDLGNNRPINPHVVKGNEVGPPGWSVRSDDLPPQA